MEDSPETRKHPAAPPRIKGFPLIGIGGYGKEIRLAAHMYLESIRVLNQPYPGWECFERDLAFQFAFLLELLGTLRHENSRSAVIREFLSSLKLEKARGRPRKAKAKLHTMVHGRQMKALWDSEMLHVWQMKSSLERSGQNVRKALDRRVRNAEINQDVATAVLGAKATPQSAVAQVYSNRNHVSFGTARNALRGFEKMEGRIFTHTK